MKFLNKIISALAFTLFATLVLLPLTVFDESVKENLFKPIDCEQYQTFPSQHTVQVAANCSKIIIRDEQEICLWKEYRRQLKTDKEINELVQNCAEFRRNRDYPTSPNSKEEASFPLAFSISMHKDVEQVERLLRLIYWPQNIYCIHVDRKASTATHHAIRNLAKCFSNVLVAESEYVYWAGYGVLKAVLNCMEISLKTGPTWRYFINLAAQDFPLKTNLELVQILTSLSGSNDVEFANEPKYYRYWFKHKTKLGTSGFPVTHIVDYHSSKLPVPHGIKVFKGNLAAALSRNFVEWLFINEKAKEFTDWLRDTDTADEHLWPSLNHNAELAPPGGYRDVCQLPASDKPYFTRFAVWRSDTLNRCSGKFVHDVCVFGLADLHYLIQRPELFANKLHIDFESKAYECMEEWFQNKVKRKQAIRDYSLYLSAAASRGHKRISCEEDRLLQSTTHPIEEWN